MTDMLPHDAPSAEDRDTGALAYRHRPKPVGFENAFRLEGDRLVVDSGRKVSTVALAAVESLRLTYEPKNVTSKGFRTTLLLADGRKLSLTNLDWRTMVEARREDENYRRFVLALVAAVAKANPRARLLAGRSRLSWLLLVAVTSLTVMGLAAFSLRASMQAAPAAALLGLAVLAVTLWQLMPMIRRNRPREFAPDAVPPDLLP
ncbi:hypothetical protein QNA08_09605 [Chelatococcus sp. SYSU_G07232]|uniref:Uncharacterized protein n=1 Tax=Chelatococcus albus TaxID=3047466 RepID=A0ABT7AGJ1_9HYPH|nr:hypothetical protein [Chelatococcus sp. SYSU_G07232]MDJ1158489.1 hypothetical protein [Chelatococcus sp. SYSU_G07232]